MTNQEITKIKQDIFNFVKRVYADKFTTDEAVQAEANRIFKETYQK